MTIRIHKAIYGLLAICIGLFGLAGTALAGSLPEDGKYEADYVILQADNDNVSMANDYWEKPAKVTIVNGKATVRLTINHSQWVTEFKVPGGSGYVDTKVVLSNKKKDTRTVEFSADPANPLISKIHVTVPDIDYDHDYTIRLVFDLDSFKLIEAAKPAASSADKPASNGTTAPAAKPSASTAAKDSASAAEAGSTATPSANAGKNASSTVEAVEPAAKPEAVKKPNAATAELPAASEQAAKEPAANEGTAAEVQKPGESLEISAEPAQENEAGEGLSSAVPDEAEPESDNGAVVSSGGEQKAQSVKMEAGDVQTASAAAGAVEKADGQASPGLLWWTPFAAILLLVGGGTYVWMSKRRR